MRNGKNEFSEAAGTPTFSERCRACGAEAQRETANYCLICGKLMAEDYEPLDVIRASYGLQRKDLPVHREQIEEPGSLFEENNNSASQTAWACVVYSMVPYLGILFVPFAFAAGGAGFFVSYRRPDLGGKKMALTCIMLSFVLLAVQVLLWWLLYIIPELNREI